MQKISQVLGIPFTDAPADVLVDNALSRGGLVVVPSGPGLSSDLIKSQEYRDALLTADTAVTDSGAMVLLMKLIHRKRIERVSGLQFLQLLLNHKELKASGSTFWVHPSDEQMTTNHYWLEDNGFHVKRDDNYVAPFYGTAPIDDPELFNQLLEHDPKVIVLCIGGGVQERLGMWLRKQYKAANKPCPAIVCTGAAIGFLSGNQVNIPKWADRLYLGWFFRCLYEPKKFIPRYWNALPLAYLIAKYGEGLPPMKR